MAQSQPVSLEWSAQYTVSDDQRQTLPGDKITLPPLALEQLLSASSTRAAHNARHDLPAYDPYNSATFAAYRQAESQYEDQRQQLPYPLTFKLVNPQNGRIVFAGIREFSAEDGEAVLSPFLKETLGWKDGGEGNLHTIEIDDEGNPASNGVNQITVTVHAKQLPKGTYVKLRPLEAGYDPEDWKALLEQHLRQNYTTLTNGEVLVVPSSRGLTGRKEEFRFLVDGFKPDADGICIVDTDLEVDIEALNEEQARETLKRIAAKMTKAPGTTHGSSSGGSVDLFNAQEGQVLPGEYVDYELSSWNKTQTLEIELAGDESEDGVDLLVSPLSNTQRSYPRIDAFALAELDERPRKRIRLSPSNVELEQAEALYITVHAFTPSELGVEDDAGSEEEDTRPRHFNLRVRHIDTSDTLASNGVASHEDSDAPPTPEDVRCGNCHQWVPRRTLMLHENFCLRNNILCPKGCGQVFQKRSTDFENHWHCPHDSAFGNTVFSRRKHDAINHPNEVLRCNDCATQETFSSLPALAHHRTTTCPAKLILCRFCHLVVPQEGDPDVPNAEALLSGMTPHELADGARTTECHLCSKIVRLRDMATHLKNHDLDRVSRPPPVPCRNVNCSRTLDVCSHSGDTRAGTRMGQGPGNDIGLCSVCFGPLYASMHDPENKALRRRVERRYLQQLTAGCGKVWCKNEFCKIGRKHLDLNSTITIRDAMPLIKPFLEGLTNSGHAAMPLHFCVDEANGKRKVLADLLAAEVAGPPSSGAYGKDWCIGALEAEKGDLDAARLWLKNWAPTKQDEGKQ